MESNNVVYLLDIEIMWDPEASVWCGFSEDWLGISLEADTLDELREKINSALPEMIYLNRDRAPFNVPEMPFDIPLSLTEKVRCEAG